jgi:glycosyltransferase involved in cell wall biosynthesis
VTSIVIPAHNEASVLAACLRGLPEDAEIIVVVNGCTDETAAVARGRVGVQVIEIEQASKAAALNAGDAAAAFFPRLYLDADVTLSDGAVSALAAALRAGALAAVPRREVVTSGRPWGVKAYYAIHSRLPAVANGLYGRGAIALSAEARSRFDHFPDAIADDLFVDSIVGHGERVCVATVTARVAAPARVSDLVRRLARVRAANAAMRAENTSVRRADRWSWLRDVVVRRPWLAPAGVWYAALTIVAARRARHAGSTAWARDDSRQVTT